MNQSSNQSALEQFKAHLGDQHVLVSDADKAGYLVEWRDKYFGQAAAVLRPKTVQEISTIVKIANAENVALVPQGGNTGLVGGQIAFDAERQFVVNMSRMNTVREIDADGYTMTVDAGVVLEAAQNAANSADRLFPLRIGSQGSCQIGGNLSSNAGGTNVVAYGNARELVLGLEVVLPNGEIINGLNRLRKNNTGYDLNNLFIGAEGTLGFITGAVLKLFPKPRGTQAAILAFHTLEQVGQFFTKAKTHAGDGLTGFEFIPRIGIEFLEKHTPDVRDPLDTPYPWYALVEFSSQHSYEHAESLMMELVEEGMNEQQVSDGVLASSQAQQASFWYLREQLSGCQKGEGGSIKTDVSVPISALPTFLPKAIEAVKAYMPDARPCTFGHWGDGNIHLNVTQPVGMGRDDFLNHWDSITDIIHSVTLSYGGSISAEHGIGVMKRESLSKIKDPASLALMKQIKQTLDPNGIMNPGKVL